MPKHMKQFPSLRPFPPLHEVKMILLSLLRAKKKLSIRFLMKVKNMNTLYVYYCKLGLMKPLWGWLVGMVTGGYWRCNGCIDQ